MVRRIIAVVLCLIFVTALLSSCSSGGPKGVIKNLEKAVNKRDGKALMKLFDPSTQEMMKGYGVDTDSLFDLFGYPGKVSLKCGNIKYNDEKTEAKVEVTITTDGETSTEKMTCVKVDGKWYLGGGS